VSIAAIHPPTAVYREEQNFGWWVYAILALMFVLGGLTVLWQRPIEAAARPHLWAVEVPLSLTVGIVLPSVLVVGVLRMTTEVAPGALCIWFGWIPTYRRSFVLTNVQRVEIVRFRPVADRVFWGPRRSRDGEYLFTARGERGVRLQLNDGTRILIGSQHPELLAAAIEQAMQREDGSGFN
jgi:hypothetical protein